jgi:putative endonuclease
MANKTEPRIRRLKSTLGTGELPGDRPKPNGEKPSKRRSGAEAEAIATKLLIEEGYRIVERNFTADLGELDIVAREGDILVFVEVRSRANGDHGDAVEMVTRSKQRRVARVATLYLEARKPEYERARFDVVGITGGEASLIRDAFRLGRY